MRWPDSSPPPVHNTLCTATSSLTPLYLAKQHPWPPSQLCRPSTISRFFVRAALFPRITITRQEPPLSLLTVSYLPSRFSPITGKPLENVKLFSFPIFLIIRGQSNANDSLLRPFSAPHPGTCHLRFCIPGPSIIMTRASHTPSLVPCPYGTFFTHT